MPIGVTAGRWGASGTGGPRSRLRKQNVSWDGWMKKRGMQTQTPEGLDLAPPSKPPDWRPVGVIAEVEHLEPNRKECRPARLTTRQPAGNNS